MEQEHFKRVAEYVAMQCMGCSDSPMILAFKAYEVMKKAVDNNENPYKALNSFLGTSVPEKQGQVPVSEKMEYVISS